MQLGMVRIVVSRRIWPIWLCTFFCTPAMTTMVRLGTSEVHSAFGIAIGTLISGSYFPV